MAEAVLLELEGVSKSFGGVKAVRDCSFSVAEGSLTGLIGPNGAGKSTTIELISGFIRADQGRIVFDGREIHRSAPHAISRAGLVRTFQTPREWAKLTALENLLVAPVDDRRDSIWSALVRRRQTARSERAARAEARRLLDEFGLGAVRNELAGNLSGGQKRLLEFARILTVKPRLVLLDEPQSGVNPVLGERMSAAIRRMADSGITVLMIEHNLGFVERLCDVVIVMALGHPIATGTMAQLRQQPEVLEAYLGQVSGG